jgi:ketopantoate reductase
MTRIAVYGAGGVGGYFGARLARAGADVHFLARGAHLRASPVPQAARDSALALAQAIEPGSFSSLHDDLVAGRRMELEALHGFVVRRAAQHALAVPMSEAVYAILQPWAVRNRCSEGEAQS